MSESTTEFSPDGRHSTRVSITGSLANIHVGVKTQSPKAFSISQRSPPNKFAYAGII